MVTFAYLFLTGSFNPSDAAIGNEELSRTVPERSVFQRAKSAVRDRHAKQVRELGREFPSEVEAPEQNFSGLSTLSKAVWMSVPGARASALEMEEPDLGANFLERMYENRPYAGGSPGFDRSLRYDLDYDSPFRHETRQDWERIRETRNQQFRGWQKEAMRGQARDFVAEADQDSAPIQALHLVKGVFGGGDLFHKTEEEAERAEWRKHRRNDVSISAEDYARANREADVARVYLSSHDRSVDKDEDIETKLRSRLNLARRMGKVELQNPVITTGAQVDLRARDRIELKATRELKALAIASSFSYGPRHKTIAMNVEKRITKEISCEVKSTKSQHREIPRDQRVQLNYRVDF